MSGIHKTGPGRTEGIECPQAKQLFSPYLDGAVTGTEMLALQGHLQACAGCKRQYESLRRRNSC